MHLKPRWKTKVLAIKLRVYLFDIKAKRLVDETFDKMNHFSRLKYTISHTLFSFSLFVVYKNNTIREKKGRAIVNIRKLNDLVVPDAYAFPLPSDIIANV